MLTRGSSSVPDGAEPHCLGKHRCSRSLGNPSICIKHKWALQTPLLLRTYTTISFDTPDVLKETQRRCSSHTVSLILPSRLSLLIYLNRTAFLSKLGITFHVAVTCLSNLGRKAAKNNFIFLTCLDLCLSRVLSNNSKWKLRQIWKLSIGRHRIMI